MIRANVMGLGTQGIISTQLWLNSRQLLTVHNYDMAVLSYAIMRQSHPCPWAYEFNAAQEPSSAAQGP